MPIPLRSDYDAARLGLTARESKDAGQTRRLLALAAIYDGASRTWAAAVGGVTLQIVRDWVLKLNVGGPEALVDYKGPGPQPILTDAHRAVLAQAIEDGPVPAIHGVVRWRVVDLVQWLSDAFQMAVSKQTLSRELRQMGVAGSRRALATLRRREAPSMPLKSLPARLDEIGRAAGTGSGGVEVWFADEARVGQKNKITRR